MQTYLLNQILFDLSKNNIEKFILVGFKNNKIIFNKTIGVGSELECEFDINKIFKELNKHNCESFIVAHNHLAEIVLPSKDDDISTFEIYKRSLEEEFNFLDHIIISSKNTKYSYKDNNCLTKNPFEYTKTFHISLKG